MYRDPLEKNPSVSLLLCMDGWEMYHDDDETPLGSAERLLVRMRVWLRLGGKNGPTADAGLSSHPRLMV